VNAVSLWLVASALGCSVATSSQRWSGLTAAGLPVSGRSANASTWKKDLIELLARSE
jgi:hypothetical protein